MKCRNFRPRGDSMTVRNRSRRNRDVRPSLLALEDRSLLNGALPSVTHHAKVVDVKPLSTHPANAGRSDITIISATNFKGYHWVNFDGPNAGTEANTGTNIN